MSSIRRWGIAIVGIAALGGAGWYHFRPSPGGDIVDCAPRNEGGCGRPIGPRLDVQDTSSVEITLSRTACFGTCPVYAVTIRGSGDVIFLGREYVKDTGTSKGKLPTGGIADLLSAFEGAGYLELADSYRPDDTVCGSSATDHPSVTTSIRVDGRTKRVAHYTGCDGAPIRLSRLENAIDSIVGTGRWIDGS